MAEGVWERRNPAPHDCPVPIGSGSDGDIWRCGCGQRWVIERTLHGKTASRIRFPRLYRLSRAALGRRR